MQEQDRKCLNCEKIIHNTHYDKKNQKYCRTLCGTIYKVKVDIKTRHLKGLARKKARWMLFNKNRVKASQEKHYRLHRRKRILNVRNWEKKHPDKVKQRKIIWSRSEKGIMSSRISSLKHYHKRQNIIKFLDMMNKPTNTFINVTL